MWQFVKAGPALEAQVPAVQRGAAWKVLRAAWAQLAMRKAPGAERVKWAQARPVAIEAQPARPPPRGLQVRVVEAVVLLAVAAYFVLGLIGAVVA